MRSSQAYTLEVKREIVISIAVIVKTDNRLLLWLVSLKGWEIGSTDGVKEIGYFCVPV